MNGFFRFTLLSILFFFFQNADAQRPGNAPEMTPGKGGIAGVLLDENTGLPVSFANVLLYKSGTAEMITGLTSNEEGRFFLKDLDYGAYDLKISFIGYLDFDKKNIVINETNRFVRIGEIVLSENAAQLAEVQVTAEREMVQFGLDKRVFNASKDLSATGGDALEVLKNIPSVSIDIDGNVSLRGSENVRILINGKPSGLAGLDRRAILAQIPASLIESVEVMTNPSAKYSPEGMAGIINIITKKQNQKGFNLQASLTGGSNPSLDGALNLNYRTGKFNFFGNYNGRFQENWRKGETFRKTILPDTLFYLNTLSNSSNERLGHTFSGGLEYYFSANSVLGANASFSPRTSDSGGDMDFDFFDFENRLTQRSVRNEMQKETETANEYNLSFNQNFKREGQTLSLVASWSDNWEEEKNDFTEDFFSPDNLPTGEQLLQKSSEEETNTLALFQGDYTQPLWENFKLETGFRSTLQLQKTDYALLEYDENSMQYFQNDTFSNLFQYNEDVYAAYAIAGGKFKKFEVQGGVRGEQTMTRASLSTNDFVFQNDYFNLFPSASVKYELKAQQSLQLSYSQRINRPNIRSVIPAPDFGNRQDIRVGNPELLPEIIHAYELGFLTSGEKGTFNATGYFRRMNDLITRFTEVDEIGRRILTWRNLEKGSNYGIELIGTYRPFKWWNFTASVDGYKTELDGSNIEADLSNDGYQWNARLTSNWSFWKDANLQLFGFYRSRGVTAQGTMFPMYWSDLGFRKPVFGGQGAISLRVSDIFNTRRFKFEIADAELEVASEFQRQSQAIYVGFSYKIGKSDRSKKQERGERRNFDDDDGF